MDENSENLKLKQEIAYLTGLIKAHGSSDRDADKQQYLWRKPLLHKGGHRGRHLHKMVDSKNTTWSRFKNTYSSVENSSQLAKSEVDNKQCVRTSTESSKAQCSGSPHVLLRTSTESSKAQCSGSRHVLLPNSTGKGKLPAYSVQTGTRTQNKIPSKEPGSSRTVIYKNANWSKYKKINLVQPGSSCVGIMTSTPLRGDLKKTGVSTTIDDMSANVSNISSISVLSSPESDKLTVSSLGSSATSDINTQGVSSVVNLNTATAVSSCGKTVSDKSNVEVVKEAFNSPCARQSQLLTSKQKNRYKYVKSSASSSESPSSRNTIKPWVGSSPAHGKNRYKFIRSIGNDNSTVDKTVKTSAPSSSSQHPLQFKSKYKLTRSSCSENVKMLKPHITSKLKHKCRYKLTRKPSLMTGTLSNHSLNSSSDSKLHRKTRYSISRQQSGGDVSNNKKITSSIVNKYKIVRERRNWNKSHLKIGNFKLLNTSFVDKKKSYQSSETVWKRENAPKRIVHRPEGSRFKFVKGSHSSPKKITVLPSRSKLKLDRRWKSGNKSKYSLTKSRKPSVSSSRLIMINGVVYSSSKSTLKRTTHRREPVVLKRNNNKSTKTISVRGVRYKADRCGKTLHRISDSVTSLSPWGSLSRLSFSHSTRSLASRALYKSLRLVATRKTRQKKRDYCLFYNRFGKCNRGDKCPYIHDPARIAVCTRFLRGTCKVDNCPFSHHVAKEKMPVCSYFLRGVCNNDNCPYLHVNVAKDAEICQDFLKGFCRLGDKCKKKHTHICPKSHLPGGCPDGSKCRMVHPQSHRVGKPTKRRNTYRTLLSDNPEVGDDTVCIIPNKQQKLSSQLPSFISLRDSSLDASQEHKPSASTDGMQIRPRFLMD